MVIISYGDFTHLQPSAWGPSCNITHHPPCKTGLDPLVIVLPTQTMHHSKGNPSKYHPFALFDPLKLGNLMTPGIVFYVSYSEVSTYMALAQRFS